MKINLITVLSDGPTRDPRMEIKKYYVKYKMPLCVCIIMYQNIHVFQIDAYRAAATSAMAAPPRAMPGLPVTRERPPVLVAEVWLVDAAPEVLEPDPVVPAASVVPVLSALEVCFASVVVDAEVAVGPAVTVTASMVISVLAKVPVSVPGKLAPVPLAISVQAAVVVPPREQRMLS